MRITGVQCDDCGKIAGGAGNWSRVWRAFKSVGWLRERNQCHYCPKCAKRRREEMDAQAREGRP